MNKFLEPAKLITCIVPYFAKLTPMSRPAINVAVRAARAAGHIILRYMNRIEGLAVIEKQRMDFASEVDKLAEAEIIKELKLTPHPEKGYFIQVGTCYLTEREVITL